MDIYEMADELAEIADKLLDALEEAGVDISLEPYASMSERLGKIEEIRSEA